MRSNVAAGMVGKLTTLDTRLSKQLKEAEAAIIARTQKALNKIDTLFMKNPILNES